MNLKYQNRREKASTFGLTGLEYMIRKITYTKSNISELRKNYSFYLNGLCHFRAIVTEQHEVENLSRALAEMN